MAILSSSSILIRLTRAIVRLTGYRLLPQRVALWLNIGTIRSSRFFDLSWYRRQLNDENITIAHAIRHYLNEGASKGLNPNRYFSTLWYLQTYNDVAASGSNPLLHYLRYGADEGRDPSPLIESLSYLMASKDEILSHLKINKEADDTVLDSLAVLLDRRKTVKTVNTARIDRLARLSSRILPTDGVVRQRRSFNLERLEDVAAKRQWHITRTSQPSAYAFHPKIEDAIRRVSPHLLDFPPAPFVVRATNVSVIGGTRHVLADENTIIRDESSVLPRETDFEAGLPDIRVGRPRQLSVEMLRSAGNIIGHAVHAMHEYSNDYLHLVTEVLPRIELARADPAVDSLPLLIDASLHPHFLDLIRIVDDGRPSLALKKDKLYSLKTLHFPSDVSSIQNAFAPHRSNTVLHIAAIQRVVKKVLESKKLSTSLPPRRRIYARRKREQQSPINQAEIEARLAAHGFELCLLDDLAIDVQIRLFREAVIVVGPMSTDLTNIVWCQPGTSVLALPALQVAMPVEVWKQLGAVSGCQVMSLQGPRVGDRVNRDECPDHDAIHIDELETWIDAGVS
jgi:capsular polysaccharide biosynthesis protein